MARAGTVCCPSPYPHCLSFVTWGKLLKFSVLGFFYHNTKELGWIVPRAIFHSDVFLPGILVCPLVGAGLSREPGVGARYQRSQGQEPKNGHDLTLNHVPHWGGVN
jgi:hypothetical protein